MIKRIPVLSAFSAALLLHSMAVSAATPSNVIASSDDGNVAANTLDNDPSFDTRWSAKGNDGSQWIRYDFGSSTTLSALDIAFYKGDQRSSYFQIQSSDNGSSWTTRLGTTTSSGNTIANERFSLSGDITARYFRIVGLGNSSNTWNSITDVEFVGASTPGVITSVPGTIQAEDYSAYSDTTSGNSGGQYRTDNVDIQVTTDAGGGYNVGWMKSSEWLDYPINVSTAGNYTADVRVASQKSTGKFTLSIDGGQVGTEQSVAQDDWQNWDTETVNLGYLSAGNHTLRLNVTGSDMNVNWIELKTADVNPTGCNIDMTIWGYTLGNGVSQNDQNDIQNLVDNVDLGGDELTWNDGCPTFKVGNDASSSSGSSYARSELRELLTRYTDSGPGVKDIENNWVTSNYTNSDLSDAGGVDGTMNATLKVNTVSVDRVSTSSSTKDDQVGRIIVGQIHGVDHEPVKIYYQKHPDHTNGSVYFTVDGASGSPVDRVYVIGYSDKDYAKHVNGSETLSNPTNGIPLGDEWSYEIDLTGDQLRVTIWHDGNVYTTADAIAYSKTQNRALLSNSSDTNAITISDYYDNDWMYFKAGLYNQNNSGVQNPNYSSVTFYAIDVQH